MGEELLGCWFIDSFKDAVPIGFDVWREKFDCCCGGDGATVGDGCQRRCYCFATVSVMGGSPRVDSIHRP